MSSKFPILCHSIVSRDGSTPCNEYPILTFKINARQLMSSIFSTKITSYSSTCSASVIVFSTAAGWMPDTLDFRRRVSTSLASRASIVFGVAVTPSGCRNDDNFSRKSMDRMRLKLKTLTSAVERKSINFQDGMLTQNEALTEHVVLLHPERDINHRSSVVINWSARSSFH